MNPRFPSFRLSNAIQVLAAALILAGMMGFAIGVVFAPETVAVHLLLLGFYGVSLGLAGALFVSLQYVSGAAWSVPLQRVPEAMVAMLPAGGVLVLVALFAFPSLYPWTNHDVHLHGELKHFWLQRPLFLVRASVYLLLWSFLAFALIRTSRRQDFDPDVRHTIANRRWSALFLVVFGATFWLASYDWLMSREPNWVSTVYGLYNFAGLFTSGLAAIVLLTLGVTPIREIATKSRRHDLAKLFFGMCVFWLYLWYCQYMLIWFVNIPEETPHYLRRLEGTWATAFYVNVALNGVIPFFVLLPRSVKENAKALANVCVIVLIGRWLDLYLMIFPDQHGLLEAAIAALMTFGAAGMYLLVVGWSLGQAALVPRNDPLMNESHGHGGNAFTMSAGGRS